MSRVVNLTELQECLRSIKLGDPVMVGNEFFPVGEWTNLAADVITELATQLNASNALLMRSCRPITIRSK